MRLYVAPPPSVELDPIALLGESLFAVVGLGPFLDRHQPPIKITKADLAEAQRLPAKVARAMADYLNTTSFTPDGVDWPAFNLSKCVKLLTDPPNAQELTERVRGLPPELALSFYDVAGRAVPALNTVMPATSISTTAGPVTVKPGLVASSRFRRWWLSCEEPMTIMSDLLSGSVSREQVQAMALVYPQLYETARLQALKSLAALRSRVKTFELPPRKDRVLQLFLQTSTFDQRLAAEIQAIFAGPDIDEKGDAIQPQAPGNAPNVPDATPTNSQALEAK